MRIARLALVAGAFALGAASASAQVKIGGKEANLANHSTYGGTAGDLPAAPKTNGPAQYCNSFTCIPDGASAPAETITIHGPYDLRSTRATRPPRRAILARPSSK